MGLQDRIRDSLMGGGGGKTDPPEFGCTACRHRFKSNKSPRHVACPECDSEDVELLANPDLADGSHPLDPRSDDDADEQSSASPASTSPRQDAESDAPSEDAGGDEGAETPDGEEAAAVRELLTTGRYRCLDCREAFDPDDEGDATCPECGSDDVKERFGE